jgi:hypothetical protein
LPQPASVVADAAIAAAAVMRLPVLTW